MSSSRRLLNLRSAPRSCHFVRSAGAISAGLAVKLAVKIAPRRGRDGAVLPWLGPTETNDCAPIPRPCSCSTLPRTERCEPIASRTSRIASRIATWVTACSRSLGGGPHQGHDGAKQAQHDCGYRPPRDAHGNEPDKHLDSAHRPSRSRGRRSWSRACRNSVLIQRSSREFRARGRGRLPISAAYRQATAAPTTRHSNAARRSS